MSFPPTVMVTSVVAVVTAVICVVSTSDVSLTEQATNDSEVPGCCCVYRYGKA